MDKGGRFREDLPARRPGRLWGIRHQQGLGFLSTPCFFSLTDILVSKPGKDLEDTSLDTRRVLPSSHVYPNMTTVSPCNCQNLSYPQPLGGLM